VENVNVDTGVKRVTINNDPNRVIEFNPMDIEFAEKFYALIQEFEGKQVEYEAKATALDANKEVDAHGLPVNMKDSLAFLKEVCSFMKSKIDDIFGDGASTIIFGDSLNLEMFGQFFAGIVPHIKAARAKKVQAFINPEIKKAQ